MRNYCRKQARKATARRGGGEEGQVGDLTAKSKPQTTLGLWIHLKYSTCSNICVTSVLMTQTDPPGHHEKAQIRPDFVKRQ